MRFTLLLLGVLSSTACSQADADKKPDTHAQRVRLCDLASRAVPQLATCKLGDPQLGAALERRRDAAASPRLDRAMASMCIEDVLVLVEEARQKGCDPKIATATVGEFRAFLDTWYAERTQFTPTGDAFVDHDLAKLAAARDAACACKPRDTRCLDIAERPVERIQSLGASVQGAAIASELSRCVRGRSFGLYTK